MERHCVKEQREAPTTVVQERKAPHFDLKEFFAGMQTPLREGLPKMRKVLRFFICL